MKSKLLIKTRVNLSNKELQIAKGGGCCSCGCYYQSSGGSATIDNCCSNADGGLKSRPPGKAG